MATNTYAVIMAGGRGERFWPLSTSRRPKQLLALVGDRTLLAQAVDRLDGLIPPDRVFVVTNADLVEASRAAAPSVPAGFPKARDAGYPARIPIPRPTESKGLPLALSNTLYTAFGNILFLLLLSADYFEKECSQG